MAQHLSEQQAVAVLNKAKRYLNESKQMVTDGMKAAVSFGAPLLVGLAEGRLAADGSGHVQIMGVPLNLGLGLLCEGVGVGLAKHLDGAGPFIAAGGGGLLGAAGSDIGRQLGLGMRLAAGMPVQQGQLKPAKEIAIKDKMAVQGKSPKLVPPAGVRVGDAFAAIGAAPGPVSADQLEAAVRAAAQAVSPTG